MPHSTKKGDANGNWTDTLAQFLLREAGVEAVRIDPGAGKVAIATLGQVDLARLREKLAAVIEAHRADMTADALHAAQAPAGFSLTTGAGGATLQRDT